MANLHITLLIFTFTLTQSLDSSYFSVNYSKRGKIRLSQARKIYRLQVEKIGKEN